MQAAFDEAEAWGKPTACHVMGSVAIERVIKAGVHILEHGQYVTPVLAKEMVTRGVYFTPTLGSYDIQTMHPRFRRGERWSKAHEVLIPAHQRAIDAACRSEVQAVTTFRPAGAAGARSHGP